MIGNHFADLCRGPARDGSRKTCGTPFGVVHVAVAFVLFVVTFSEALLADAVRKYARDLGEPASENASELLLESDIKHEECLIDVKT